jgi:hypothetical protein
MVLIHPTLPLGCQNLKTRASWIRPRQELERMHRASAPASLDCCDVPDGGHKGPAAQSTWGILDAGSGRWPSACLCSA